MGSEKQKVTQEERNLAEFSKRVMDKGSSMADAHTTAATRDMLAKTNASVAAQLSARDAGDMKNRLKNARNQGIGKTTQTTIDSAKGNAGQFALTASATKDNLHRLAKGAQGGVKSAAQALKIGGKLAKDAYADEHDRFVLGNKRRQGVMDLASFAAVEGLGSKWDADALTAETAGKRQKIQNTFDASNHQTAFDEYSGGGLTDFKSPFTSAMDDYDIGRG